MSEYIEKSYNVAVIGDWLAFVNQIKLDFPMRKQFCLVGELGAGKTTFTKVFCESLGIDPKEITSPTFGFVKEYAIANKIGVYHLDLYRLSDLEEAMTIDIDRYLYNNLYCFIEWPQAIYDIIPLDFLHMKIEVNEDGSRQIIIRDFKL